MSMTMMALRIAAVEALKSGNTLVGSNVLDSQVSAIDLTADGRFSSDQEKPFIAVYTDRAKSVELSHSGLRSNGAIEVVFNYGISQTMAKTNKATGETEILEGFPASDAVSEAALDVLDVEISRVLSDPDNAWSQVFRDLCRADLSKEHSRSGSAFDKMRIAVGQMKLTVEAFADPTLGAELPEGGPWKRFVSLMQAGSVRQLPLFLRLLGDGVLGPYADFEALTGMSKRDAKAMGLYSFDGVPLETMISGDAGLD